MPRHRARSFKSLKRRTSKQEFKVKISRHKMLLLLLWWCILFLILNNIMSISPILVRSLGVCCHQHEGDRTAFFVCASPLTQKGLSLCKCPISRYNLLFFLLFVTLSRFIKDWRGLSKWVMNMNLYSFSNVLPRSIVHFYFSGNVL